MLRRITIWLFFFVILAAETLPGLKFYQAVNIIPMRTTNLVFRDLGLADIEEVYEYATDAYTVRFLNWMLKDLDDTGLYIQKVIAAQQETPRHLYKFGIVEQSTEQLIGEVELVKLYSEPAGRFRLILHKKHWNKGYGSESAAAMLTFAFKLLRLDRVYANCHVRNEAGIKMLERLAAKRIDPQAGGKMANAIGMDQVFFQLSSEDFFSKQNISFEEHFRQVNVDK